MAKNSDKPAAVKEAELHGGETFDPTLEQSDSELNCPDCGGEGIRSPIDIRVCSTCQGTGRA